MKLVVSIELTVSLPLAAGYRLGPVVCKVDVIVRFK